MSWFLVFQVDQWLDACWNDFEVPVEAMAVAVGNQAVIGEAKRHALSFLSAVNARLETRCLSVSPCCSCLLSFGLCVCVQVYACVRVLQNTVLLS